MTTSEDSGIATVNEEALSELAAAWFLRLQSAGDDTEIFEALEKWLAEDARHEAAFHKVQTAWEILGDHARVPEILAARNAAKTSAHRKMRIGFTINLGMRSIAAIAAAILMLVLAAPVFHLFSSSDQEAAIAYETSQGETRVITLSDNSKLSLDSQTKVVVAYSPKSRSIQLLNGQAFFDVAKNPSRPFEVKARKQTVVALGTAFNVDMMDNKVRITLIEGHVSIADGRVTVPAGKLDMGASEKANNNTTYQLAPGQQLVVADNGDVEFFKHVDLARITAWRQDKVIFEDDPLSEAVTQMNRHSRIKIVVQNKKVSKIRISGVFNADDPDAFVQALEMYFPVRAMRVGESTVNLYSTN